MSRIIARSRLGNTTEDIASLTSGPFTQFVVVMDGYDVLAVPSSSKVPGSTRKLFDVLGLGIKAAPRGIAYLPSENLLVVNDITQPSTLFLTDFEGQPRGTRTVEYLDGFVPDQVEGIATLPQSRSSEQLVMAVLTLSPELSSRLVVLSLVDKSAYQVRGEIFPADPVGTDFVSGVTPSIPRLPRDPNQFLVSYGNLIQSISLDGSLVGDPVELINAASIEGLDRTSSTTTFAADINAGTLFALDQNLNPVPKLDRDYKIGVGLFNSSGLAWDASAEQHLLLSFSRDLPDDMQISQLPPSLDSASALADLTAAGFRRGRKMTYVPQEELIAVAHQRDPKGILLFNQKGALMETVDLSVVGSPLAIAYISTTNEFVVRVSEAGKATTLFVVTRTGQMVRTIDLSQTGIRSVVALTFFNPQHSSGGQFFIVDGPLAGDAVINLAFVTDFNGTPLNKIDYRAELGVLAPADVATITTGKNAGALSIVDRSSNELIVFELDSEGK